MSSATTSLPLIPQIHSTCHFIFIESKYLSYLICGKRELYEFVQTADSNLGSICAKTSCHAIYPYTIATIIKLASSVILSGPTRRQLVYSVFQQGREIETPIIKTHQNTGIFTSTPVKIGKDPPTFFFCCFRRPCLKLLL